MHSKVLTHFKKADPILYKIIKESDNFEQLHNERGSDYFEDLVGSITSQQLSTKAAATIFIRIKTLFKKGKMTPKSVLKLKDEKIKKAGMSMSKIKYIKDLAQKVKDKEIDLNELDHLEDEEIIRQLVSIKGIGRWTAEMFLIFSLKRENVFSHGDLGLNNAIKKIYKLETYSQEKVEKIVSRWTPYKSYASLALWKSLDNR